MKLSIIIPIYNESKSIAELYDRLRSVLEDSKINDWEVWLIDDGSKDNIKDVVEDLKKSSKNFRYLKLRKNLGKTWALRAGLARVKGDIVVTMDGDLQDEPENLPSMLRELKNADLVVGWKKSRYDDWTKVWPSRVFNWMVSKTTGLKVHDLNCGLKVMKRKVADELILYGELHRFVPLLAHERGFRVREIVVQHAPRKYGVSKYGWKRMFVGLYDLMTLLFLIRFGRRPGQYFGIIGSVFTLMGVGTGSYLTYVWFMGEKIGGRPLLNLAVLLVVVGIQMVSFGFLAEMMVNMKMSSDELPIDE